MEMTLNNLVYEIARLRMENLRLQHEIKRLEAKTTAASPEAHEMRKRRPVPTAAQNKNPLSSS